MIEVRGLTKTYGEFRALDGVSFDVERGQILAFLGPNGAGKSTTMKILTGFLAPSAGRASVGGRDVVSDSLNVRRQIGYLPESTPLYYDMQVNEFLALAARLRRIPGMERRGRLSWVADVCGIKAFWKKPIATLSRGQKQRVGFAQAILHDPAVLILDEPTAGLDPNQIVEVRNLIRSFSRRKTIILSTHILQEVEALCRRTVIIHRGRKVADGDVDDLRTSHGHATRVVAEGDRAQIESILDGMEQTSYVLEASAGGVLQYRLRAKDGSAQAEAAQRTLGAAGISVRTASDEQASMEDVFRTLTGTDAAPRKEVAGA